MILNQEILLKNNLERIEKLKCNSTNVQSKGMVEERRDGYVVEDWDITNLKVGQAIIGFPEYELLYSNLIYGNSEIKY